MNAYTPPATKAALIATPAITVVAIGVFVAARPAGGIASTFAAPFMWLFSSLFLVRVVGQLFVRLRRPAWLPPTEQWNLSPYRLLLPTQIAILALMAWIDISFTLASGAPADPNPDFGKALLVFAYVYAGVMAVRYLIRMSRRRDQRWLGGTIPIVFHWVLAAYLYVFGSFHASH